MDLVQDDMVETFCGPLCQHPSCWSASRRQARGIFKPVEKTVSKEEIYEGLPSQSVVNLLDDYGEDPRDKFPSKWQGRPLHERAKSVPALDRAVTRESFPRTRAPNATPASPLRSTLSTCTVRAPMKSAPPISKVEVQEVFDLDDLQSDWHDTFMAKKFYVWVSKKSSPRQDLDPLKNLTIKKLSQGPNPVLPKDKTEEMVPREVEWERERNLVYDDVWPVMKKRPSKGTKSPTGGRPYRSPHSPRRQEYFGLYELLDLPRDVLTKVLEQTSHSDLQDRHRLSETLLRILPQMEKDSTAISLASSDVLRQKKMRLLEGTKQNLGRPEPLQTQQVYKFLKNYADHYTDQDLLVYLLDPKRQSEAGRSTENLYRDTGAPPGGEREETSQVTPRSLNMKKPLPDIAGTGGRQQKQHMPSISLGLPEIPPGVQTTKTFTYDKQTHLELFLGRIPTPPELEKSVVESPKSSSGRSSTIHVTVPSGESFHDDLMSPVAGMGTSIQLETNKNFGSKEISQTRQSSPPLWPFVSASAGIDQEEIKGIPEPALHAISPDLSTKVPKTPAATPNTRQSLLGISKNNSFDFQSPVVSPVKMQHAIPTPGLESPTMTPRVPLNTPAGHQMAQTPLSPEATGLLLDTIEESEPDMDGRQLSRESGPPGSRGRRSVHFAPDIPPQPPSSPTDSNTGAAGYAASGFTGGTVHQNPLAPVSIHHSSAVPAELSGGLMVVGVGSRGETPGSRGRTKKPGEGVAAEDYDHTPDPWPQVQEEQLLEMPPRSATYSLGSMSAGSSKKSGTPASGQRDPSSAHSERAKQLLQEAAGKVESPAPPPPSPEPREDQMKTLPDSRRANGSSGPTRDMPILEEIAETDSEVTISAAPPSNLDDLSRINTPNTSRDTTGSNLLGEPGDKNGTVTMKLIEDTITEKSEGSVKETVSEAAGSEHNVAEADKTGPNQLDQQDQKEPDQTGQNQSDQQDQTQPDQTGQIQSDQAKRSEENKFTNTSDRAENETGDSTEVNNLEVTEDNAGGSEIQQERRHLDEFQATEESLKEELKEEYKKLSEDTGDPLQKTE